MNTLQRRKWSPITKVQRKHSVTNGSNNTKILMSWHRAFSIEFLRVSRPVQFPDTSNNHYQSHGLAATEILHHLDLYLSFLRSIADSKALGSELNHLEQNVEAGLKDPPTLTELSVMSLYSQVISVPFTQRICTPNDAFLNGLHWGQGGTYPGDTLRIHWGFLSNLSTHYPGDTCW